VRQRDPEIEPNAPDWTHEQASDSLLSDDVLARLGHEPAKLREEIELKRRLEEEEDDDARAGTTGTTGADRADTRAGRWRRRWRRGDD
jgi:hypothetical protein